MNEALNRGCVGEMEERRRSEAAPGSHPRGSPKAFARPPARPSPPPPTPSSPPLLPNLLVVWMHRHRLPKRRPQLPDGAWRPTPATRAAAPLGSGGMACGVAGRRGVQRCLGPVVVPRGCRGRRIFRAQADPCLLQSWQWGNISVENVDGKISNLRKSEIEFPKVWY